MVIFYKAKKLKITKLNGKINRKYINEIKYKKSNKNINRNKNKKLDKIHINSSIYNNKSKNLNKLVTKNGILDLPLNIDYIKKDGSSPLNKIYTQIYVINLKKRDNRLRLMKFKLEVEDIAYIKVNAIDGSLYKEYFNSVSSNGLKTTGAYGLLVTFVSILRHAMKNNYDNILVLEDDCNFIKNFNQKINQNINQFNFNKTPIIYLGATQYKWGDSFKKSVKKNPYYLMDFKINTYGTFAISFHKSMYQPLLNYIFKKRIAIDNVVISLIRDKKIQAKIFYPNLIIPDRTTSDIQSHIKNNQGNHNIEKYYGLHKWNINNYRFLSLIDYDKLPLKDLESKINLITDDKISKIYLDKNLKIGHSLLKKVIKFLFENTNTIYKYKLLKLIQ